MKKGILILATALCISGLMTAQEANDDLKGAHPYKTAENEQGVQPEYAHWSIIPHFGFNAFDGDFTQEMKHNVAIPSAGLALEYNFTPVWNVGVEYMYNMYNVTGKEGANNADTLLTGHMHRAGAYISVDLINLFFPKAQKKIVSIFPYVGAGGAWYKRAKYYMDNRYYDAEKGQVMYPTHGHDNTANYINADGENAAEHDNDYKMVGYIQAGLNLEFNLNRTLALGVRANYSYFTRDYVDGRGYHKQSTSTYASKNNDGIFDVTLNLRFKLVGVSKSHVRNLVSYDQLEKGMNLPVVHDTVIIQRDTTIIRETNTIIEKEPKAESVYYVYFANDKADLDEKGLITIQQVADRMQGESELYAVVTGYCDNTGSVEHNYALGDKRAENVISELREEYGIPEDHVCAAGMGKIKGRRSTASYGPNRRAAIRLVDYETFVRMCSDLEELKEMREDAQVKTLALSETARKEKINAYKLRPTEPVKVDKNTTLARLARKYYDNTFCWVYIYLANRDRIVNTNTLPVGLELNIPELTEEELKTSKEECLALYTMARNMKQ